MILMRTASTSQAREELVSDILQLKKGQYLSSLCSQGRRDDEPVPQVAPELRPYFSCSLQDYFDRNFLLLLSLSSSHKARFRDCAQKVSEQIR